MWLRIWCLAALLAPVLAAAEIDSRKGQIEADREAKASQLSAEETSRFERILLRIREDKILERFSAGVAGFRMKLGGLVSGSGFAMGPEYLRRDLAGGRVMVRGSAVASLKQYQLYDLELGVPKLAGDRLFLDLYAVHRNFPRIDYYGPGPSSYKTGRSDFRLEDTAYSIKSGVSPIRHMELGGLLGYLQVNVGPGGDPRFVSSEQIYTPVMAPGLDHQSNFLRGGFFARYDYRDIPGGPRKGGNYLVEWSQYSDQKLGSYSFQKLDLEAQQYVPFFNERRVFAFRAKSVLTDAGAGQQVPFYLQPTLGGSEDLRGFRPFRFYDNNMIALNAEYRWETFSGLDTALFVDSGKVFHHWSQWNLHSLEVAYGFGLRFNVQNSVFLRVDVGFSHEGFQVWFKFNNVF
ncbi:MAG TPA: BamA/TamA family outer membrane protein [Bryobacteraceae bacterium]|nr:BamA/TamA family outer membrane protein [Bryobacteraceae bacterium]